MDRTAKAFLTNIPVVIGMTDQLPVMTEEADLRAFLLGLQALFGNGVSILIAITGHHGHHPQFHRVINIGWSEQWVSFYLASGFADVDPVLNGATDTAILWSEALATLDEHFAPHRRFLHGCQMFEMMYGVSYIHDYGTHRVTLSFAGKRAEDEFLIRHALELAHRHLAITISRILAPRDLVYELSETDLKLVTCLISGLKDNQTASKLGMALKTVRTRIAKISERYGAETRAQLIYILLRGHEIPDKISRRTPENRELLPLSDILYM